MAEFFIFFAFIVVFFLYVWLSYTLLIKYAYKVKEDRFIDNELLIIVPNLFLFASLFIIGRFFNLNLVLLSIVFSNIGMFIAFVIWGLIGSPQIPYKAIGGWAGYNFGIKNVWFSLFIQIISFLILVLYPIVIGVHYFNPSLHNEISIYTLKCTLILILVAYFLMIPTLISVLGSNFIDEDSRARYLISQFSGLIPYSLFISLMFWLFNWGSSGKVIALKNVSMNFNPLLFTFLMAFFLVFFLLPYFIGIQRARQVKNDYLESENDILDHIIESIDLATQKNIIARLEDIEHLVENKFMELKNGNMIIEEGLKYDELESLENLTKQEIFIYDCYKNARPFDTRFIYYDFLNSAYQHITELKSILATETDSLINKETLQTYSSYYKERKKELNETNEKKSKSNPALWIGVIAIASPFVSQVMAVLGQYLIEYFKKT